MKREKFKQEIEQLGYRAWIIETAKGQPIIFNIMDGDDIISTVQELKEGQFDFYGSRIDKLQRAVLLDAITKYALTELIAR